MPEYIELEKALESLQNKYENMYGRNPSFYAGYQFVLENLKRIKSADVAPVIHAKWLESVSFESGFWVCSNCNFVSEALAAYKLYNYCPNCGAKMDLEEDK